MPGCIDEQEGHVFGDLDRDDPIAASNARD